MSEQRQAELPNGWALTTLGEPLRWGSGGTPLSSRRDFYAGEIPWAVIGDLNDGIVDETATSITEEGLNGSSAKWVEPGSVLLAMYGSIGKLGINSIRLATNQAIAFTLPDPLSTKYLFYYLMSARPELISCGKGGTQSNISQTVIKLFPFIVAPLPEQNRIVDVIESHLTRLDDAMATLERVQRNLKRYRASVLKAAVEGRLVPTEAELARKEGRAYEPASVLLERILAERRRRWEEAELAKLKAKGKMPKDDKWKAKYVEPAAPDTSELPELPEGWCWTSASQLSQDTHGAISAGPFGTIFKAKDFRPTGVPIIQIRHVKPDRFLTHGQTYMDERIWEELFRDDYSVFGGELLITKLGDPPGDCAIFPGSHAPSMLTPDVIKLEINERLAMPRYVMHYINSILARKYTFGAAFGTTRLRLTLAMFREMPIPVPPLNEQVRIAEAIDRLLTVAEDVRRTVQNDKERIQRLRQSILKWAFEGRLVDQDPSDEPASVLLERIQAERATTTGKAPRRPRRVIANAPNP